MKTVNNIAKGAKFSNPSRPGTSTLDNQTLKKIMAKKLETADATSRALDDILYPRSSAKPTTKTGTAEIINELIHQRLNQRQSIWV